jgi:hypothetical protein
MRDKRMEEERLNEMLKEVEEVFLDIDLPLVLRELKLSQIRDNYDYPKTEFKHLKNHISSDLREKILTKRIEQYLDCKDSLTRQVLKQKLLRGFGIREKQLKDFIEAIETERIRRSNPYDDHGMLKAS